ncbi:MAG: DNA gyrase subunit A [Bdellovibrionales bacterium]|nr:DNA gyrase subunit A [Bdellovibrionales bacterium]
MADLDDNSRIANVDINKEMREAYLQYSMSVIVGRALPDVRDGLKPVHRRVLYAMNDLGNTHDKPYKKSARIVGDVIGKYHPHGDMAVYDTMVRMAQDFSLRYPLIDGQGNFGSIDGDSPAAPRYTEVRMTPLAEELLADIEKDTVSFGWNYDDSLLIPQVLPAKFPNLLINGSAGIAVGMATNIPPHNMREVIEGCVALIKNPKLSLDELIKFIPGPDFPTAGVIAGTNGILQAYKTGRGVITLKAVAEIVPKKDREEIIITEIPYQVNKAKLIESIADLVKDKKVEGISDIRDESSREGMRIVILLKRGENAQVVLNRLYKFTQLQVSFGIIMLALDARNQPVVFDLKQMLEAFVAHRKDVVTRRCIFDLKKAEARAHILEGLKKALDQIDAVIATIRAAKEADGARAGLISQFGFSEKQATAILEMRLQRLTGLERQKILDELAEVQKHIAWLKQVLGNVEEIYKIIVGELEEIKKSYGDERRTKIERLTDEIQLEDLIAKEDMVISMTFSGYIKRISMEEYRLQKRGGKGLKGAEQREEDYVWRLFMANTHTTLLSFSDRGKAYWTKVHELPAGSRTSKGKAINNVLQLSSGEQVRAIVPIEEFKEDQYVVMLTVKGIIKKTSLEQFSRPRPSGIIALTTDIEDNLIGANVSTGKDHIFIVTREGMSIRFPEEDVRPMGRGARGVRGVSLAETDRVVGVEVIAPDSKETILIVTEKGFGKRTVMDEYRIQGRGGMGVITAKTTDKAGMVVTAKLVTDKDQILLTTNSGQAIRIRCSDIRVCGRNTQGVKLMNLNEGEYVTSAALLGEADEDAETAKVEDDGADGGSGAN